MVTHHSLSYFNPGHRHWLIRYVDFVTGGFVFAAGFLAAYLLVQNTRSTCAEISRKSLARGLRIALVFLLANLAVEVFVGGNGKGKTFGVTQFVTNIGSILVVGRKDLAAFPILLPIAYTQFVIGLLVWVQPIKRVSWVLTVLLLGFCMVADETYNARNLAMGLVGISLGLSVSRRGSPLALGWEWLAGLAAGAVFYMVVITAWGRDNALIYAFGITCVLGAFYAWASRLKTQGPISWVVLLLGQYSLFAYLAHICLFQVLSRTRLLKPLMKTQGLAPFFIAVAFLVGLCCAVRYCRRRSSWVDSAYHFAFG
ncbi:MAG TPA: hypothetical protein VGO59_13460 [Verrucomicrobiae bacterium]|jgi:hypothetical protein